jgi:hypothetical protein
MRVNKTWWAAAAAAIVFGAFSAADAQTAVSPEAAAPIPAFTTHRDVNLSLGQMQANANGFLTGMNEGSDSVRHQLEQARAARDVVKILCLNDKLNQIDVAIRSARDRLTSLELAAQHNDTDRSRHEFEVIQVLRDRVRTLVAEANQCIGEETGFVGESRVTVNISPNIPDTDPSRFPENPILSPILSQPPVLSSPTR